jgi:acyl-CoA synthetase (AMP-forming)/AMP-acid ligase II
MELIDFCHQALPAGMLPDVWQFLDALPRTDRGKIDLQALQRP